MKAKIEELKGKYYGTKISVTLDDGTESEIEVWIHGKSCNPSIRELSKYGFTQEQWDTDPVIRKVDSGDEYLTTKNIGEDLTVRDEVNICDSHYESAETYEICLKIADALNAPN